MFCNRCGTEMPAGSETCPKCGRRIGEPVSGVAHSRLERHLHTLGVLWMVIGGLFLIPAVGLMVFGSGLHFVLHERELGPGFFQLLLYVAGSSLVILAAGGVCVGLGLMQRAPWARTAAIILGVLALFHPPFGTALGVYSLWVLLADERGDENRYLARAD
jgi:zinc ribbon protein